MPLSSPVFTHARWACEGIHGSIYTTETGKRYRSEFFFFFCRQLSNIHQHVISLCVCAHMCVRVKICMFNRDRHTCVHRDIMCTHRSRLCAPLIHNSSLHSL